MTMATKAVPTATIKARGNPLAGPFIAMIIAIRMMRPTIAKTIIILLPKLPKGISIAVGRLDFGPRESDRMTPPRNSTKPRAPTKSTFFIDGTARETASSFVTLTPKKIRTAASVIIGQTTWQAARQLIVWTRMPVNVGPIIMDMLIIVPVKPR